MTATNDSGGIAGAGPIALLARLRGVDSEAAVDQVAAGLRGEDAAAMQATLAASLDRTGAEGAATLAKTLLRRPDVRRSAPLLRAVVGHADDELRAHLHRFVFVDLHGEAPIFDLLYHALTLSSYAERAAWLRLVDACDAGEMQSLLDSVTPAVPAGYELVDLRLGSGKTSRVARVRRSSDGAEFAWKIPADDGPRTRRDLESQVRRSLEWGRLGVSSAVAAWAPDGRTILQPYVAGSSLGMLLREDDESLVRADDPRALALAGLLAKLVKAHTFVSGLNADNLIYDGTAFQIVDSGSIRPQRSGRLAWYRQRVACARAWTRGDREAHRPAVRAFLERTEAMLPKEHRLTLFLRTRYALRRIRGR